MIYKCFQRKTLEYFAQSSSWKSWLHSKWDSFAKHVFLNVGILFLCVLIFQYDIIFQFAKRWLQSNDIGKVERSITKLIQKKIRKSIPPFHILKSVSYSIKILVPFKSTSVCCNVFTRIFYFHVILSSRICFHVFAYRKRKCSP